MRTIGTPWRVAYKGLLMAVLAIASSVVGMAQPRAKAVLELGNNQTGKVIEYQSGERQGDGSIRYEAKIDGRRRVVTYRAVEQEKAIVVSIDDGAGGAAMEYKLRAVGDAGASGAAFTYQKIEWIIKASGQVIAQTNTNKDDKEVLIILNKGAQYDAYSMDILLHLPSEVAALDPVKSEPGIQAQGLFGKIIKFLGGLLTGGAKWERDCQKTKEKVCTCSAACTQAPGTPPGDCSCGTCCGNCCGGTCTESLQVVKNCTQTASIGKTD